MKLCQTNFVKAIKKENTFFLFISSSLPPHSSPPLSLSSISSLPFSFFLSLSSNSLSPTTFSSNCITVLYLNFKHMLNKFCSFRKYDAKAVPLTSFLSGSWDAYHLVDFDPPLPFTAGDVIE